MNRRPQLERALTKEDRAIVYLVCSSGVVAVIGAGLLRLLL